LTSALPRACCSGLHYTYSSPEHQPGPPAVLGCHPGGQQHARQNASHEHGASLLDDLNRCAELVGEVLLPNHNPVIMLVTQPAPKPACARLQTPRLQVHPSMPHLSADCLVVSKAGAVKLLLQLVHPLAHTNLHGSHQDVQRHTGPESAGGMPGTQLCYQRCPAPECRSECSTHVASSLTPAMPAPLNEADWCLPAHHEHTPAALCLCKSSHGTKSARKACCPGFRAPANHANMALSGHRAMISVPRVPGRPTAVVWWHA